MTFNKWYKTKEIVVNPDIAPIDGTFFVFDNSFYIQITEDGMFNVVVGSQEREYRDLLNAAVWLWDEFARAEVQGS